MSRGDVVPRLKAAASPGPSLSTARKVVYRRSGGRCEARVDGVCTGVAVHVHHVRHRRLGHDPEFLLHVCRPCHEFVHANTRWARDRGFLDR